MSEETIPGKRKGLVTVMADNKYRDEDLVFLCAALHAREAHMLTPELADRMLGAANVSEAFRILAECGYPDMTGSDVFALEDKLSEHRAEIYGEISAVPSAVTVVGMFMLKYDYHNVKSLVKSMGSNENATRILSASGRVSKEAVTEAFITGVRDELPQELALAMSEGVGTLSRTSNPQISDINADRHYFKELLSLAKATGNEIVEGYARLLIDSANLRTYVRVMCAGKPTSFLDDALFEGGNVAVASLIEAAVNGAGISTVFTGEELENAVSLADEVIAGGRKTMFERACDNAVRLYADQIRYLPFGKAVVLRYLLALDWEMTTVRMIMTGRLAGVSPDTIRERLREAYV